MTARRKPDPLEARLQLEVVQREIAFERWLTRALATATRLARARRQLKAANRRLIKRRQEIAKARAGMPK